MKWHDFFYFSKGERRALTLLLSLIAAAWLTLFLTDPPTPGQNGVTASAPTEPVSLSGTRPAPTKSSSSRPEKPQPLPRTSPENADNAESPLKNTKNPFQEANNPSSSQPHASTHATSRKATEEQSFLSPRPSATAVYLQSLRASSGRSRKLPAGSTVELNTVDTALLKKVPGIGSTFARRIVKYRDLLGGFYSVRQLSEVYGIDEERYQALAPWFTVDPKAIRPFKVNRLETDTFRYHPYVNYRQRKAIRQQLKQKGRLSGWENLQLLEEFTPADRERLAPYFSFE